MHDLFCEYLRKMPNFWVAMQAAAECAVQSEENVPTELSHSRITARAKIALAGLRSWTVPTPPSRLGECLLLLQHVDDLRWVARDEDYGLLQVGQCQEQNSIRRVLIHENIRSGVSSCHYCV